MAYNNTHTTNHPLPGTAAAAHPTYGSAPASGPAPHTAGHHRHDLLNKLDPSVDSSRDKVPLPPPGTATNGPHSSRLANKLDPTVDTNAYERANMGLGGGVQHHQGGVMGTTGGAREGTYGPHSSRMANAADPRVDSDRDGRGAGYGQPGYGGATAAHSSGVGHHGQAHHQHVAGTSMLPGPAPNTAGPHKSDLLNKLDPTVDSKGGMTTGQQRRI